MLFKEVSSVTSLTKDGDECKCIKGNCIKGKGTIICPDGEKYVGQFKDGQYDGQGVMSWSDGQKYVGQFKEGKYEGKGTMTWPDGSKYVGKWKDELFEGKVILLMPDGGKYVGQFKDDQYEGQGTLTWPDGRKYVGQFKDGLYEGQGTLTWPDGRKYVGRFKDGLYDGQGTIIWPDGRKLIGQLDKKGKIKTIGNMEMVYIEAGTFKMGSTYDFDESPVHKVTVDGFWIGKYEVTQREYEYIMGTNPSNFKAEDFPVEQVSWEDAVEFCKKFSEKYNVKARLPYEAEWEYASRGGTNTKYYWGDEINGDFCWYSDNSGKKVQPVGKKNPNAFGIYDMSGNLWEWCSDWGSNNYYKKSPLKNPEGASIGSRRILRGGSFLSPSLILRSSFRRMDYPGECDKDYGFRVVVT